MSRENYTGGANSNYQSVFNNFTIDKKVIKAGCVVQHKSYTIIELVRLNKFLKHALQAIVSSDV